MLELPANPAWLWSWAAPSPCEGQDDFMGPGTWCVPHTSWRSVQARHEELLFNSDVLWLQACPDATGRMNGANFYKKICFSNRLTEWHLPKSSPSPWCLFQPNLLLSPVAIRGFLADDSVTTIVHLAHSSESSFILNVLCGRERNSRLTLL